MVFALSGPVDIYKPDLLYFDDSELPLGDYGLDIAAHFYNNSVRDTGHVDVVLTAKNIKPEHEGAFTLDIECGKGKLPSAPLENRYLHWRLAL